MLKKYWKWLLVFLFLGVILVLVLFLIYLWYFPPPPRTFAFGLRQRTMMTMNRLFPGRLSSPYGEIRIQDYVPKEEKPTTVTVMRGVVKDKDLPRLAYAIDVSGTTYYIQFDEARLRDESQHVLIPHLNAWQSIVITPETPVNLLCTGDVVEVRIDEKKQQWAGDTWASPLSPENVIVVEMGRSCLPREVDTRVLSQ